MSLIPPNLDDRRFDQLVEEAQRRIRQICPEWSDVSPSDPGGALLDVFAYLTEIMIYRLNRLPEKAYVEFLRLIGVRIHPPAAATVLLQFSLQRPQGKPVEIPRGTRVTTARTDGGIEPPIFATADTATTGADTTTVKVRAYHCDWIEAELSGAGSGLPGLTVTAARPPIVAPNRDGLDLVVGVETDPDEIGGRAHAVRYTDKVYRIWREVESFTNVGEDESVYIADRLTGTITFAPALNMVGEDGTLESVPRALADIPKAGREIRLWYRRGGGVQGNVAAGTLTTLKDPIRGVEVTNPEPAIGGRSAETLENTLLRGPQELHSLRRAITARDFELVAMRSSGAVERAKAFTKAMQWAHAPPGTVEVRIVPSVPAESRGEGPLNAETLRQHQNERARVQIEQTLAERRPLGTRCEVNWARYKTVRAKARIIVHREEDPVAVRGRVLKRLYEAISPLSPSSGGSGRPFGQPLTAWDIYRIMGSEPGVKTVEHVRLLIDEAPSRNVLALAADAFQARTWYAGAGDAIFRSRNNGRGWELVGRFPGETVGCIKAYPREAVARRDRAGLLAVATEIEGADGGHCVHISQDCGESWEEPARHLRFRVEDLAWMERDTEPRLLLATERGLYDLGERAESGPVQILVDPNDQELGFYAVAVSADVWGQTSVAVAARGKRGVFLSSDGGRPGTFHPIGLEDELVRVLAVQHRGPHRYLWAGVAAPGSNPGKGCFRWQLTGSVESPEGWRAYPKSWQAGGCRSLAFQESLVLAASLRRGALRLDVDARDPAWEALEVGCGLPLRDVGRLQPVDAVATDPESRLLMAAGIEGIYRSDDHGLHYQPCSNREFSDQGITIPATWLFCSGEHEISVVSEDEAK